MTTQASRPELQESREAANSAAANHDISLLDILIVFASRKRTILTITGSVAILAVIVSLLLPKRYTAAVTLLPPKENSSLSGALASQLGSLSGMAALASGGGVSLKNPNDMYVAMFRSRSVEDAMIQRFGLQQEYHVRYMADARKEFEKHASVDASGKDGLIHIEVENRDPQRAALLANSYVDAFRHLSEHLAITEASQRRLFFEQQLQAAKDNLAKAEEELKKTQQQTGLIQLDSQARALIESAATLRAQIAAKEVQIHSLESFATDQNAQLVQAQRELESLREQLRNLGGSEGGDDASLIVPKGKVPEAGLEYVRKLRDVKYNETIFEILARQFEMAKLDEAKEGAMVQVVDPAVTPEKPSFPRKTVIVIAATLIGFIVALFIALLQTGFERLQASPETSYKMVALRRALSSKWRAST